jgi:NAD(P)-dependent dehydrogenase (short-subunit alcohol dehydrogenase family)
MAGTAVYLLVSQRKKSNFARSSVNTIGANWTTDNIPDLTGKVIIVTGANSGIGFEAAKEFARKGAQTILACRSMDKAQTALSQIQAEIPNAPVKIMQLDLASLASVRQFAEDFKAKYDHLDVLVNNAGIMMVPYSTTEDGFERQFGTNHLGHFALTGLLLDLILKTPGSRVVNVSSSGHRMGSVDFDNLIYDGGNGYSPMRAYGRSKLANLLFTYELQRRFEAAGVEAMALAAHPGSSSTNLGDHLSDHWYFKALSPVLLRLAQSSAMGALPTIRAAVDPNARGGEYYGPGGFMEQRGYPVTVQSNETSHNEAIARQLWQVSEDLTSVDFGPLDPKRRQ